MKARKEAKTMTTSKAGKKMKAHKKLGHISNAKKWWHVRHVKNEGK